MFTAKDYAFQIKVTLDSIFKRSEHEMGGISQIYFIEKQPFIAIAMVLGNFYNKVDNSFKNRIDDFLEVYSLEMGKSITEIGEEKIKRIMDDFKNIVSTI